MSNLDHWPFEDNERFDEEYPMVYEPDSEPVPLDEEEDDGILDWIIAIGAYLRAVERGEDPGPAPFEVVFREDPDSPSA